MFSLPLPGLPCLPCRQDTSGLLYYQFEFTIESPKWKRHNVAVLATQVGTGICMKHCALQLCGQEGVCTGCQSHLWAATSGWACMCNPQRRLAVSVCAVTPCLCLLCLLCVQDNLLYTLNVQCPQSRWAEDGEALKKAAASLRIKPMGNAQYPGAL